MLLLYGKRVSVCLGPTSYAPIIETAIGEVDKSGGQYHVLLIIVDGQVSLSMILYFSFSFPIPSRPPRGLDIIID